MTIAPKVSVQMRAWDIRLGTTGSMTIDAAKRAEAMRR